MGFSIEEIDEEYGSFFRIKFPKNEENISIEEQFIKLAQNKRALYITLGLENKKEIVQRLGKETVVEQSNTIGKYAVQNEVYEQMRYQKREAKLQEQL